MVAVDGFEQALGHAFGFAHEYGRGLRRKRFGGGLLPDAQPALEMLRADARTSFRCASMGLPL